MSPSESGNPPQDIQRSQKPTKLDRTFMGCQEGRWGGRLWRKIRSREGGRRLVGKAFEGISSL